MRTYGQYCALAKSLDVIGDRWSLLIVRELLIRDGCRYTDLRNGLPGIATNLLAERLQQLEETVIVYREAAPPPIATTLYHLTSRGKELEAVVDALGRWGKPLLATAKRGDACLGHWLALPLHLYLRDVTPERAKITLELRSGGEPVVVETVGDGTVRARPGTLAHPDARLTATPQVILGLLLGKMDLRAATSAGLQLDGDPAVLQRIRP